MAVKTPTPNLDHISLRETLNRIANQPDLLAWALAAVGFLYGDLAKQSSGCPPIGDTLGTPLKFRFGDFPHTTTSDTPSDETRRATESNGEQRRATESNGEQRRRRRSLLITSSR